MRMCFCLLRTYRYTGIIYRCTGTIGNISYCMHRPSHHTSYRKKKAIKQWLGLWDAAPCKRRKLTCRCQFCDADRRACSAPTVPATPPERSQAPQSPSANPAAHCSSTQSCMQSPPRMHQMRAHCPTEVTPN
jgi:hypothetical protein